MQLFIRTVINKTITFNYNQDENPYISDIMKTIEKKTTIPLKYQKLQFGIKGLEPYKRINDYNIRNNNTIHQYSRIIK